MHGQVPHQAAAVKDGKTAIDGGSPHPKPPPSVGQLTAPAGLLQEKQDLEKAASRSEDEGTLVEHVPIAGPTYPDGGRQAYCAAFGG